MRRSMIVVAFALVGLASGCAQRASQVSSVDAVYVARLNNRLAGYNQTAAQLDADLKQRAAATNTTVPVNNETAASANTNLPDEILRDAEAHARASILTRFMHEAAASGQIGFMTSWIQEQAAELVRYSKTTDESVAAFQKDAAAAPHDAALGSRFFTLLLERGAEHGAAEELMTLSNDVQGYARDYAGAAAIDRQRQADTVRLLSAYLSAPRVTVQAPTYVPVLPAAPTFTTCMPNVFGSVNCVTH